MFNVGVQLRKTRKKCNLTLDQLAASSGVDRGTISRIELGHVSPRIDTIGFLCEAMNIDVSHFFERSETDQPAEGNLTRHPAGSGPRVTASGTPAASARPLNRDAFDFPEEAAPPPMDGYWPVPSSFWRGLLEVLERFEILIKNSHEMILVKDASDIILYLSPPCEAILGYRPQDLLGQNLRNLIHPEDLAQYEQGVAHLSGLTGESRDLDYRMRCKDGAWRWFSSRFTNQLDTPSIQAMVVNAFAIQAPRSPSK